VHAPGAAALARWGLLDQVAASGCPPIRRYQFDLGPFSIEGTPLPASAGIDVAYSPRRTVLDKILLDAAVKAGVEVRENVSVRELIVEDGRVAGIRARETGNAGAVMTERASLVIGADGRHSLVAEAAGAGRYRERPAVNVAYYAYWSDLPADGFSVHLTPGRAVGIMPTHDRLTVVTVAARIADMSDFRRYIEGNYLAELRKVPGLADRTSGATRESRFTGTTVPNYYREPFGPGWALAGDAGYERDPCTAQGMTDAFRHAELLAGAWLSAQRGERSFEEVMAGYQSARDEETLPVYEMACDLGSLAPPPPEMAALLEAVAGNPGASGQFVSAIAGTFPVTDFFSPASTTWIMAATTR
jgi:2-polyprenyl-6-methoxyphenol hydroxylase-like FAD-dependent oxidoreductase